MPKKDELIKTEDTQEQAVPVALPDPARKVTVRLFKDNARYKEPVFVAVNGMAYSIPRGVEVEVPYYVAAVIANQEQQDTDTAIMITEMGNDFAKSASDAGYDQ